MNTDNCITSTSLTVLEIVADSGALAQWIDKSLTGSLSGAGWAFFFCGIAVIHFFLSDVGKASSTRTVSQSGPLAQEKNSRPHHPSAALAPQAGQLSCWLHPPPTRWFRNLAGVADAIRLELLEGKKQMEMVGRIIHIFGRFSLKEKRCFMV